MRLLIAGILSIHCIAAIAQPSTYYDRQAQNRAYDNLHNATTRAFSVPSSSSSSSTYKSPSSSGSYSSPSSSSSYRSNAGGTIAPASANNWANTDYHDWQVRQGEELARKNAARQKAFEDGQTRFRTLIRDNGIARTEGDHFDLLLTGMRAGIELNAIYAVIGYDIKAYGEKWGTTGAPYRTSREAATIKELLSSALTAKTALLRAVYYGEAAKLAPSAELYRNTADAYREDHNYPNAIRAYAKAEELQAGSFRSTVGWAAAYGLAGNAAEGEQKYLQALQMAPEAPLEMNIVWMRLQQGAKAGALEYAQKAALKSPGEPGPVLAQAALTADAAASKALLDKAVGLAPALAGQRLPQALFAYAKFLQKDGAYELSILYMDLAMMLEPANMDVLELRYGTNKLLKRTKASEADEELLTK